MFEAFTTASNPFEVLSFVSTPFENPIELMVLGSQACLNGLLIYLLFRSNNRAGRAEVKAAEAEAKANAQAEALKRMDKRIDETLESSQVTQKQLNGFINTFLKPDPKLFEWFQRQITEKDD